LYGLVTALADYGGGRPHNKRSEPVRHFLQCSQILFKIQNPSTKRTPLQATSGLRIGLAVPGLVDRSNWTGCQKTEAEHDPFSESVIVTERSKDDRARRARDLFLTEYNLPSAETEALVKEFMQEYLSMFDEENKGDE